MLPLVASDTVLFPGSFVSMPVSGSNARALEAARSSLQVVVAADLKCDVMAITRRRAFVGTVATVTFCDGGHVVVTGLRRVRVDSVKQLSPCVTVACSSLDEPPTSQEMGRLATQVLTRFRAAAGPGRSGFALWLESLAIPDDVVNFVASNAGFTLKDQQALLEMPNAESRALMLLDTLAKLRPGAPIPAGRTLAWWWLGIKRWWLSPRNWWAWAVLGVSVALLPLGAAAWWLFR